MTGYIELAHGNAERATTLLEEALALSREIGDKGIAGAGLLGLGIAATLRGEPERAKTLLKESLVMGVELGTRADISENLEGLAETAGALGEDVRAARLWASAGALRETIGHPWWSAERLLHEPQLTADCSRMDEATWEAAFAEGQAMTFEEAIEYALAEEEDQPAPPAALWQQVPPTDEQVGSLTRREREVATLVARGFTNRQVSTELSISERTAGNHVAKILKKLGIRSRAQIASWVSET